MLISFFFQFIGDQVHEGPPIQLGRTPERINVVEIDTYELFRHRRRDRHALAISTDERFFTLLSLGYSEDEIIAATVECAKVKHERCLSAGLLRNNASEADRAIVS
jgi:hypothetical protein